jgi:YVTN family beta-propeller protein
MAAFLAATVAASGALGPEPLAKVDLGGSGGIVVAARGSLWVTDTVNRLVQIDTANNKVAAKIPAGFRPLGIAYGSRSLWVASSFSSAVIRVDPTRRKVLKRIPVGISPYDVAFGAGAAWASNETDGTVSRISPRKNRVVARIRVARQPNGITSAFGSIWVASLRGNRLQRINPARNRVTGRVALAAVDWITASPDSLWVSSERGRIFRVNPQTLAVTATVTVGANPLASAWIGGELWVPNIDDDTISIVDPATNTVRRTIPVGDGPIAVAGFAGDAWVTHERGALWRLPTAG